ncbi:MAG: hypothetical protein AB2L11_00395 [Syntrophobacteraceae bacterium]
MMLVWLIVVPTVGGLLAWILGCVNSALPRFVALAAMVIDFFLGVFLTFGRMPPTGIEFGEPWPA